MLAESGVGGGGGSGTPRSNNSNSGSEIIEVEPVIYNDDAEDDEDSDEPIAAPVVSLGKK